MLQGGFIFLIALLYIGLLFAIATYGDRRAEQGRSIISSPYIYALSLAVYCTAWTFYGSVGRAASSGVGYLPIYLGPTLTAVLWWMVLRKMIRISKVYRITSIADFVASRYGKSSGLAALVTVIAVTGGVPYIALQLKAISVSFQVLSGRPTPTPTESLLDDTALYVTLALALFSILFGTRHLDATERHEGLVAAIAFESLVKLPAFVAVGLFVTFGLYDGPADLFGRALARPEFRRLLTMEEALGPGAYGQWFWMTLLAMLAILFLPRQFQVAVVENVDERHLRKAIWLFPLYLWLINLFVLPIALAGLMAFPGGQVDADMFVLAIPLAHGQELLALLAFIGGFSAATSMVIVATVALSTMISNDLIMPILLRIRFLRLAQRGRLTGLLLGIRRGGIVLVLVLSYLYFHAIAHAYALVSIGLISFAAVAQFAPAILGGMYWRRGTRAGALCG
nr:sodium:solute symporter [Rhodothermus marinus]